MICPKVAVMWFGWSAVVPGKTQKDYYRKARIKRTAVCESRIFNAW